MEKIIEVKNLFKKYKNLEAVNGISFDVYKGEIFGLLGPNGAGKTTTLEIMETLREKTKGEVLIDGYSIDKDQTQIKRIIGVQLQSAGFYPNLYLEELIKLFAGLYNVEVDPEKILASVDLLEKRKSKFKELSGGQKQRFSIATTLINTPKIIFLDEPTTGLDPQARRNLWDLILKFRELGTTIMLTTHYMDEAEVLCDRVGIIDKGKILVIDTPDNLIEDLLKRGFTRNRTIKEATLEDVFIDLTGKDLRDE
ncbi:MAG TPA: ABC transporter ATP-binding protein [Bacteroidetes bacterium]|nr:ABC transporter ATP-binding protein [Bacteroidota bacterium]HCN37533.1 ABC transporter ATP-binding protein [Bacteroidota bacterium]